MSRKTISKYFHWLIEQGLIEEDMENKVYKLRVLSKDEANLIECHTLETMVNVLRKDSINIYVYLYNRFYANGGEGYVVTIK